MAFQYLNNVPAEQALQDYTALLNKNGFGAGTELIPVSAANGRITAKAVYAHICAPHYPASAMDGIALDSSLTFGAGETTPVVLTEEQFTVVDTGDPIPDGCDAVIMVEDVIRLEDGTVKLYAPAAPWQHIRQIGEDICAGEMILPSYEKITPAAIGSLLAGGVLQIEVLKKPVIGIIPTGDEVVAPTDNPKSGDVIEFNSSIFSAMLSDWGAEARTYPIVPDKKDLIRAALLNALEECDFVLLNAGSSAGRDDYSSACIGEIGEVLYHGISIKPGKPTVLGCAGAKPVLGVPGYPVSGILVIELFVKPLLDIWFHRLPAPVETVDASLAKTLVSGLKYREFVRVRLGKVNGQLVASPLNRGSGVVTSFMKADGILEIEQGKEGFEAGENVIIRLLHPEKKAVEPLFIIGSHDPLLDELSDMLHRKDPGLFINSTHVGSMGGLMAIRRGEAHLAGTHLLDEKTGEYNTSYIEKHFPNGGVRLVECVYRTQGLMVAKGNPLGITRFADVADGKIRYVNRQKGSGTRILTDYLLHKENLSADSVKDYSREEFTHTSVAAQIAGGSADAGMGIYSAAHIYDLDFIPVCPEQYDLLISDAAWELDSVQLLLEVLRSEAFRTRLEALGGYELKSPGQVRRHF